MSDAQKLEGKLPRSVGSDELPISEFTIQILKLAATVLCVRHKRRDKKFEPFLFLWADKGGRVGYNPPPFFEHTRNRRREGSNPATLL